MNNLMPKTSQLELISFISGSDWLILVFPSLTLQVYSKVLNVRPTYTVYSYDVIA